MKAWVAPNGLHIEPAVPADADPIARLHAAAFYRGWPVDDFAAYIRDARRTPAYVACDARRRIAGFAVYRTAGDSADLLTIAIDRRRRGKGLGSALLRASIEDLHMSGVTHVILEVEEANAAAIAMYERFGFARVSRRPDYYSNAGRGTASALVLRCDLQ